MKKALLFLILITAVILTASCSGAGEDVPDGMQIIDDCKEGGYIFYAPKGWTAVNSDGISAAKTIRASMTFTEATVPFGSVTEYFEKDLEKLPREIRETLDITLKGEECLFGNADGKCYKYIYSYEYEDEKHTTLQILINHNYRFYIFTYTSYGNSSDENSDYRYYLDMVTQTIDNFKFTEESGSTPEINYGTDPDGFKLVSDRSISGFDLYVPNEYEPTYSSGYVKVKIGGTANLSLTKATETGIGILDYLTGRKNELMRFATDIKDIKIGVAKEIDTSSPVFDGWQLDVLPEYDENLIFGNLPSQSIVSYEYSYNYNGTVYHVYQLMGVNSLNGYVFTYTAFEDDYALHIDNIKAILKKVKF